MYFLIELMNGYITFVWPVVDFHTALRRIHRVEVIKTESMVVLEEDCFVSCLSLIHYTIYTTVCTVQRDVTLPVWIL